MDLDSAWLTWYGYLTLSYKQDNYEEVMFMISVFKSLLLTRSQRVVAFDAGFTIAACELGKRNPT